MDVLWFIIVLLVGGLIVGALGRLLVPGPDPMGLGGTIMAGIAGSLIGGLAAKALFHRATPGLLFAVLGAALVVYLVRLADRPRVV